MPGKVRATWLGRCSRWELQIHRDGEKKKPEISFLDKRVSESTHVNAVLLAGWQSLLEPTYISSSGRYLWAISTALSSSATLCGHRTTNLCGAWRSLSYARGAKNHSWNVTKSTTKKHLHYIPWYLDTLYIGIWGVFWSSETNSPQDILTVGSKLLSSKRWRWRGWSSYRTGDITL